MRKPVATVAAALVLTLFIMATSGYTAEKRYSVSVLHDPGAGYYLVDGNGMTLYTLTQDLLNQSVCEGTCIVKWPPFHAMFLDLPANLNPGDFEVIIRPDGLRQMTFRGWPLYYFYKDKVPGEMKGHGVKDAWVVANPDCEVCYP